MTGILDDRSVPRPDTEAIVVFNETSLRADPIASRVVAFILGGLAYVLLLGAWTAYHPPQGHATDHQIVEAFACGYALTDTDEGGAVKNYPAQCAEYRELSKALVWKEPHHE
jgi:hypothetical protein